MKKHLLKNTIFSLFFASLSIAVLGNGTEPNENTNLFGGIEVGAKGVKMSVISLNENFTNEDLNFKVIKDSSINTNFIDFNEASLKATEDALVNLYLVLRSNYKIASNQVFTAISSGVKSVAEKNNKIEYIDNLIKGVKQRLAEEQTTIDVITGNDESIWTFRSLIPEKFKFNTLLLDIGSGNSKGGYFLRSNNEFKPVIINAGTKSIVQEAEKGLTEKNNYKIFIHNVYNYLEQIKNTSKFYDANTDVQAKTNNNIILSGGISWAISVLTHPENIDKTATIMVSYNDLIKLHRIICENYEAEKLTHDMFIDPTLDPHQIKSQAKQVNNVLNVYDTKSLLAGLQYVISVYEVFEVHKKQKSFLMTRAGRNGWLPAFIIEKRGSVKR